MIEYILVKDKKELFEGKTFCSTRLAFEYAEENLSEEDYEDVLVYTKKELLEELKEDMFMIVDWANNVMFKGITFLTAEDAREHADEKLNEDDLEDIYVIQVKEYNKTIWAA